MSYNPKDSKYRPPEVKDRDYKKNGSSATTGGVNDFNKKGKIESIEGSDYHEYGRKTSGLYGNFAEKDASMEYLRGRNKEGQRIRSYSGTNLNGELKTGAGVTAFDAMPIPETYHPATSQGSIPPNAVVYETTEKTRNKNLKQQVTSPGDDHLTEDQTKHLKSK